jgi:hypothetical protein
MCDSLYVPSATRVCMAVHSVKVGVFLQSGHSAVRPNSKQREDSREAGSRPFATLIPQSCVAICNSSVPLGK